MATLHDLAESGLLPAAKAATVDEAFQSVKAAPCLAHLDRPDYLEPLVAAYNRR